MRNIVVAGAALISSVALAAQDPSAVVLENGANKITAADFEAAMTRFPENLRGAARAQPDTIMKIIDGLFVNRGLAQKAVQAGLDKDPLFQKRLEQLRESYLAQKYLEHVEATVPVPNLEARARELYTIDPKRYTEPAVATVSHIIVSMQGRTPELARARALEARAKLASGAPLAEVAAQYSDFKSRELPPGELGPVKKADLEPALADAVFSVKPGEWSQPIETKSGVHLVRVTERKDARIPKFEEVKALIIEEQAERIRKQATEAQINAVRHDPKNTIYRERVEALRSHVDPLAVDQAHRDAIDKIQGQR